MIVPGEGKRIAKRKSVSDSVRHVVDPERKLNTSPLKRSREAGHGIIALTDIEKCAGPKD